MDREKILGAKTLKSEPVDVPEWDVKAHIRSLSAVERVHFSEAMAQIPEDTADRTSIIGALLLVNCLVDDTGQRILKNEDASELVKQDGELVNRLCTIANRVNKIGADAEKK